MKKIIAAALSVLVGAFGYTIVDQAMEDRVTNLESEVVELREEVSNNHPQYSEYGTTNDQSMTIGSYLTETSDSLHKFLIREYTNGNFSYIPHYGYEPVSFVDRTSATTELTPTRPTTTQPITSSTTNDGATGSFVTTTQAPSHIPVNPVDDYFLYITESSAQITDISDEVTYIYGYDKDYSWGSKPSTTKTTTYITVSCKGYTDPALSGKKPVFYIVLNDIVSIMRSIGPEEIIVNKINPDGSFEYKAIYATTRKDFGKYSFTIIDIV